MTASSPRPTAAERAAMRYGGQAEPLVSFPPPVRPAAPDTTACGRCEHGPHNGYCGEVIRKSWGVHFCSCGSLDPIAPKAAPDTTGGELRRQFREALLSQGTYAPGERTMNRRLDALLAAPALRALIAERDTLAAKVQAVEGLAEEMAGHGRALIERPDQMPAFHGRQITMLADRIRRALGTPTTGGAE